MCTLTVGLPVTLSFALWPMPITPSFTSWATLRTAWQQHVGGPRRGQGNEPLVVGRKAFQARQERAGHCMRQGRGCRCWDRLPAGRDWGRADMDQAGHNGLAGN
jgi:hypothetical protein